MCQACSRLLHCLALRCGFVIMIPKNRDCRSSHNRNHTVRTLFPHSVFLSATLSIDPEKSLRGGELLAAHRHKLLQFADIISKILSTAASSIAAAAVSMS